MDFLSITDCSSVELLGLLKAAGELKSNPEKFAHALDGKTLALFFEKPSTRTRISFEVGMLQLGGFVLNLRPGDMQLGRGETVADSARVMSRYVRGIMGRVNSHQSLLEFAEHATVPVINGLSDVEHPCQALADLFTISEAFAGLDGSKVAYVGDGNNVCHSLMLGCAMLKVPLSVATPPKFEPSEEFILKSQNLYSEIEVVNDPIKAVTGADVIYTDVWVSMGDEEEKEARLKALTPYQVNAELLASAKPGAMVMHCLPAHRGQEITDEVIDGENSLVWDQAENRMHAQKALLLKLLG